MARNLSEKRIIPLYEDRGCERPICTVGNTAIVFKVECEGKPMALRVYMRSHRNLRAIYGDDFYPKELLVHSSDSVYGLADVVLLPWHEGVSMQKKIEECASHPVRMEALSRMFEEFAHSLLGEKWAHGDIKPENIILTKYGLRLIDFDAAYVEGLTAIDCEEIGTRQYQHPQRSHNNFGKSIDDYPIALIVTALAAIAVDGKLARGLADSDYLLIRPELAVAHKDAMLDHIQSIFAERGDVRHYRIADLLHSPYPALPQLRTLLEPQQPHDCDAESLSLEYCNGLWGFAAQGRFVIPPLYDLAFEFSEGLALVRVGEVWHFINARGEVVITCGRGSGIKPMRDGVTRIVRDEGEFRIYADGRVEAM